MRLIKTIILGALLFGVLFAVYTGLPKQYRYEVDDWYHGLMAPKFIDSPDHFSPRDQADLIREYENRQYKLKCYGNLRTEEKIAKTDDYSCNAFISSAFDNVPAKQVTFFFSRNKLSHVRMEFPEKSYVKLNDYLNRKLADFPRLDQKPGFKFGTDNFGKPLMVWAVREGLITTSAQSTAGQTQLLLWSAVRPEVLRPLQELGR
jgi:hypothetical protein